MSVKSLAALFSALNLFAGAAVAQSIFDKAPKPQAESKEAAKPAAAAALATLAGAAQAPAAAPPAPKPSQLTIKDLADKQAAAMAADANKSINPPAQQTAPSPTVGQILPGPVIGELKPVAPIPVSMANPPKPLKSDDKPASPAAPAKPARPYLAAVVGFAGKELAEIHVGSHIRTLKVGDSIDQWKVTNIVDGRLMLSGTTSKKVKKKVVTEFKERVMSVGDSL